MGRSPVLRTLREMLLRCSLNVIGVCRRLTGLSPLIPLLILSLILPFLDGVHAVTSCRRQLMGL